MIEFIDFTHSNRKVWKTINKLTKENTRHLNNNVESLQTMLAPQLLLNGKRNKDDVPQIEKKTPKQDATESMLTPPLQMVSMP